MLQIPNYLSTAALFSLALVAAGELVAGNPIQPPVPMAAAAVAQPDAVAPFARVGDSVITQDEYNAAFTVAARAKFYHGKPPEHEIAVLQRAVGDQLITRILLQREAKRRGLRADAAEIQKTVQSYEQRYAGSEQWKKNRAQVLPPLVDRLEQDNLVTQLENTVRSGVKPNEKEVKAYFAANQAKFTEPQQLRVSVILLKVDPSAPAAAWKEADEAARTLAKRARAGEDFAALARQHSVDPSAQQGGDMGYLHGGMLAEGAQDVLVKMKAGEISDSLRLLQGFAVFRLTDIKAARLQEFDAVKVRARELTQRELSDRAWTAFVADLKAKTPAKIDQSRFLPLVEQSNAGPNPATLK